MVNNIVDNSLNHLVYDMSNLGNLKRQATKGSQDGIAQVAKQFEDVFVQMMMKSMRQAIPEGGLLNSSSMQLFTSMFDQQVIQQGSSAGFGLANMLIKQMSPQSSHTNANNIAQANTSAKSASKTDLVQSLFSDSSSATSNAKTLGATLYQNVQPSDEYQKSKTQTINKSNMPPPVVGKMMKFVNDWLAPAQQAAKKSGIPYEVIIAQAALETGWGEKQIKTVDGQQTYNHFGIKASPSWKGQKTTVTTTEYLNNERQTVKAQFRVYDSHTEALEDYTRLITRNPRYQSVVNAATPEHAARALQDANYATSPDYADKLIQLIDRIKTIEKEIDKPIGIGMSKITHSRAFIYSQKKLLLKFLEIIPILY